VPGSRVNHNDGDPSTIEIQVYHFSGVQSGSAGGGGIAPSGEAMAIASLPLVVLFVISTTAMMVLFREIQRREYKIW